MKRTISAVIIGAAICLAAGVGFAQTDETTEHKGHGGHDCPMMGKKEMPHKKMHADKQDKGSGWFCPATGRPMMKEHEPPACPRCGRPMQRMHSRMMGGMMQGPGMMPCGMGMGRGRMHGGMGMMPCMQKGGMMHGRGMGRMGMMPCGGMGPGRGHGPMHGPMHGWSGTMPCMRMGGMMHGRGMGPMGSMGCGMTPHPPY